MCWWLSLILGIFIGMLVLIAVNVLGCDTGVGGL